MRHVMRRFMLRIENLHLLFVFEAFISSFYIVITRGLTPIFLVSIGFGLREILLLNVVAYVCALGVAGLIKRVSESLRGRLKIYILFSHALERVLWGTIPFLATISKLLMCIDYVLAVSMTIPTTTLLYALFYSRFDERGLRSLLSRRGAFGAVSNILGQIMVVSVLISVESPLKYLRLYSTAMMVGLSATLLLAVSPLPGTVGRVRRRNVEEANVKIVDVFVFLALLLSSGSLLGIAWAPYLMTSLGAPDYMAASLGLVQTISTMLSSLFWGGRPYRVYKLAIMLSSLVPLSVMMLENPFMHLGIVAVYAFSYTGSNFLASLIYGSMSREESDPLQASTALASAASLAQVIGSSAALLVCGETRLLFLVASVLSLFATVVALTTIPEVAVVREENVRLYSRILYNMSVSSYHFTIFTLRSAAVLAVKLLGITAVGVLLYIIYRTLYYVTIILHGGMS